MTSLGSCDLSDHDYKIMFIYNEAKSVSHSLGTYLQAPYLKATGTLAHLGAWNLGFKRPAF